MLSSKVSYITMHEGMHTQRCHSNYEVKYEYKYTKHNEDPVLAARYTTRTTSSVVATSHPRSVPARTTLLGLPQRGVSGTRQGEVVRSPTDPCSQGSGGRLHRCLRGHWGIAEL